MFKANKFSTMNNQFATMMDTTVLFTNASIECFKQVALVQCESMSELMQKSIECAKTATVATAPAQAINGMQQFAKSALESAYASSKEMTKIMNNTKSIYSATCSATAKDIQDSMVKSVSKMTAELNPTFSKVANASIQKFISTSNQAADAAGKASAQMSEAATKNFAAAAKATLDSVKKASVKTEPLTSK